MVKRTLFRDYDAAVWDPNLEYIAHNIEMVQHNAVRFISRLKGRDSITSALESSDLEILAARHGKTRHSVLLKLLANKENHISLIKFIANEDLMNTRPTNMPTTREAAKGDPRTVCAKTSAYHNSFLPGPARELKANFNKVSVISKCNLLLQSIALLYNYWLAKDLN